MAASNVKPLPKGLLKALGPKPDLGVALANITFLGLSQMVVEQIFPTSTRQQLHHELSVAVTLASGDSLTKTISHAYLQQLLQDRDYIRLSQISVDEFPITAADWERIVETQPRLVSKILARNEQAGDETLPASSSFIPAEWMQPDPPDQPPQLDGEALVRAQRYYGFPIKKIPDFEGDDRKAIKKYVAAFFRYYLTRVNVIPALISHYSVRYIVNGSTKPFNLSLAKGSHNIEPIVNQSQYSFWDAAAVVDYMKDLPGAPILRALNAARHMFKWLVHGGRIEVFRQVIAAWSSKSFLKLVGVVPKDGCGWFVYLYPKNDHEYRFVDNVPQRLFPFVEILVGKNPNNAQQLVRGYDLRDKSDYHTNRSCFMEDLVRAGDLASLRLILDYVGRAEPKPAIYPELRALAVKLDYQDIVALFDNY